MFDFPADVHVALLFWSQEHYSCECVTALVESVAVSGKCEGDCQLLSMFLVIFALIIFVTFTTSMPALAATLRCVRRVLGCYANIAQHLLADQIELIG